MSCPPEWNVANPSRLLDKLWFLGGTAGDQLAQSQHMADEGVSFIAADDEDDAQQV